VGQIQYFADREVTLPGGQPGTRPYSDLFAEWALRPVPAVELTGALEYDPDRPAFAMNQLDQFQSQLAISAPGGHSLTARYLSRTNLENGESVYQTEEADTRARLAVARNWDLFGGLRRSLLEQVNLERRAGVDYHAGCWGVRLEFEDRLLRQATSTADPEREKRVFLTLQFRTLGGYEFGTQVGNQD
jgi:LPS-assembly protein